MKESERLREEILCAQNTLDQLWEEERKAREMLERAPRYRERYEWEVADLKARLRRAIQKEEQNGNDA